jgi:hypothetical protein
VEKVIVTLRGADADEAWCRRLRGEGAAEFLDMGVPGHAVNVHYDVVGLVTLWTQQYSAGKCAPRQPGWRMECDEVAAYLVTESVPMPPPNTEPGERTPGLANVALLRRPGDLDEATWRQRWHVDHAPVAIETQSTFGYTQNEVRPPLTADAPVINAIVEELFPIEAISDRRAFFGAADDDDLRERMERMVASTAAFGVHRNVDTVPTSRYVFRTPFANLGGRESDDHA